MEFNTSQEIILSTPDFGLEVEVESSYDVANKKLQQDTEAARKAYQERLVLKYTEGLLTYKEYKLFSVKDRKAYRARFGQPAVAATERGKALQYEKRYKRAKAAKQARKQGRR
jgi:hypothetical protein